MTSFCESLRIALKDHPWEEWPALPGRTNDIRCGVVVPVHEAEGEPTIYAGARSKSLGKHAGEVCFPGGRPEAGDEDLWATAIREAKEELSIEGLDKLGRLSSVPLYTSDYRLEPYIAVLGADVQPVADGQEIVEVLPIALRSWLSRSHISGIPWMSDKGEEHLSPVFEVGDYLMFGGTAYVFLELLGVVAPLLGGEVPPIELGTYRWADILPELR